MPRDAGDKLKVPRLQAIELLGTRSNRGTLLQTLFAKRPHRKKVHRKHLTRVTSFGFYGPRDWGYPETLMHDSWEAEASFPFLPKM
jgi:hypothetical protein